MKYQIAHGIGVFSGIIFAVAQVGLDGWLKLITELGAVAALIWYLWFTAGKILPGVVTQLRDEADQNRLSQQKAADEFRQGLEDQRNQFLDALRNERETRLDEVKALHMIISTKNDL